jgi:hypothetical protein
MATGCLSIPESPDIEGVGRFAGQVYFTSRWPHDGVDFTGQRVAVIGTGSSGIQVIPLIARQASQLTVFQRTPNFSIPAHNGPAPADRLKQLDEDRDGYRHDARWSRTGVPNEPTDVLGVTASEAVRRERFEAAYFGTKRPCLDTGYFDTYNLPHVRLVDLRRQPVVSITEDGIETAGVSFGFDAIVYATGFDAMTHDRRPGGCGCHRPGRPVPQGEVGGRAVDVPGAHDRRVPELLHAHRARQPFRPVEHGRIDRAGRQLGGPWRLCQPTTRALLAATAATRPPGPDVGEVIDGAIPGPAGDLPYRLYRPAGPPEGPRPLVVYFHGGGWVLGNLDSDDPLCRDLCARSGAVVVSVNYRHAPEARFPAAALAAFAAVQWAAANAVELMQWFWDHYADPADRGDPRAAPLRGRLESLPPACVVTADFDPLATRASPTHAPWRPPGYRSASPGPAGTPTRR